jgi:hypothetical protein
MDRPLDSVFLKKLNTLFEGKLNDGSFALERLKFELLVDGF